MFVGFLNTMKRNNTMENNIEDLKIIKEVIASLTESKKEILKCLNDEKIDNKLKEKMFKHLKKIDVALVNFAGVIYEKIIYAETEEELEEN